MCVSVQYVAELLHEQSQPIVSTCSAADVQAAFNTIVTRIQRLWVTYMHTYTRIGWMTQPIRWRDFYCLFIFYFFYLIILSQSSPNYMCLMATHYIIPAHAAKALTVREPILSKYGRFLMKSLSSAAFSVSWIHLLGCHLLRMSCQWETRLSRFAVLLLSNMFFSLIQLNCNFLAL